MKVTCFEVSGRNHKRKKWSGPPAEVELSGTPKPNKRAEKAKRATNKIAELKAKVWRDTRLALAISLLIIGAKTLFEKTDTGHVMAFMAYDVIENRLKPSDGTIVNVVGTDKLPTQPGPFNRQITDRKALMDLMREIAKYKPAAIGVDIDFSPDEPTPGTFVFHDSKADPAFFEECLRIRDFGVPVFLACYLTSEHPEKTRFVEPKYGALAASPYATKVDNRLMPVWSYRRDRDAFIRSLGSSLANAYRKGEAHWRWPRWFAESEREVEVTERTTVAEVLIDYSDIDKFELAAIQDAKPADITKIASKIPGSIVLLGAVDPESRKDVTFSIAGLSRKSYTGVFKHACVASTLATRPLSELTFIGNLMMDIALSGTAIFGLAWVRLRSIRSSKSDTQVEVWQGRFTWIVILLTVLIGIAWVNITHIMWDGFLFVCIALIIESRIEPMVHQAIHRLKGEKAHEL